MPFSSTLLAEDDLIADKLEVDFFLGLISFGLMPVKARICYEKISFKNIYFRQNIFDKKG